MSVRDSYSMTVRGSYGEQEPDRSPSLPLFSDSDATALQTVSDSDATAPQTVSGIDWSLRLLFLNGLLTFIWGIALIVFQTGHVPISWGLSQYGQRHQGITNVIVTLVATLSTSHLQYTVKNTFREYSARLLWRGFTLRRWGWIQAAAQASLWPPLKWRRHPVTWLMWLLVYGLMGAHSACLVAILQPQSRWKNVVFNDTMPCGVDPKSLTLNPNLTVLPDLDKAAEQVGLQFGNYYNQVAANTTTAVTGRSFVKDNLGYGALGGLINGLQEVPGVEIVAECVMPDEVNTVSLAALWSAAFPGQVLPAPTITNGSGTFGALPNLTSHQAVITSAPTFNLTGTQSALYAIVNGSGNGGLLTVNVTGGMAGCTWTAIPRLVRLKNLDWVFAAIGADNATTLPLPTGRAVYLAVQGMAQAVRLGGARLDWVRSNVQSYHTGNGGYPVPAPVMLQTLLADALKGTLTAYNTYATSVHFNLALTGARQCRSNNRTLSLHWHFGNEHNVGWIAIALSIVFGGLALWVVWNLRKRERIKGPNALKVVDAFKLGVYAAGVKVGDEDKYLDRKLYVRNGRVQRKSTD